MRWDTGPIERVRHVGHHRRSSTTGSTDGRLRRAVQPRDATYLLSLLDSVATFGDLRFGKEPDVTLPLDAAPRVASAEQSNTSVVFEEQAVFKVFRRVTPGVNPDIELNRVLARAGNPMWRGCSARTRRRSTANRTHSGMVTEFAANSAEGWDMATASTRDLFAEGDLYADEVGGDFAGESYRLGEAVASVHATLAEELGTSTAAVPDRRRAGAAGGRGRRRCPSSSSTSDSSRSATASWPRRPSPFSGCTATCTSARCCARRRRWLLIDFEGEPGQPLDDRRRPDSTAARRGGRAALARVRRLPTADGAVGDDDRTRQLAARAREWVDRNCASFCEGYAAAVRRRSARLRPRCSPPTNWTRRCTRRPTRRGTAQRGCPSRCGRSHASSAESLTRT